MERETSFARSAVAGAAAAGAATVVFHPVDTIKTVLQHSPTPLSAVSTARTLGVRGLYRAVGPAAFSMAPACAVRMGTYEAIKAPLLRLDTPLPQTASVALASAISVVASAMVRSPLDMVKTRMQASAEGGSTLHTLHAAWGDGGVAGIYRGVGLALMRDVPFFSINLALYERLKASTLSRSGTQRQALSGVEVLLIGAVAQGVAGFCTNPVDVLKTRVQAGTRGEGVSAALQGLLREAGVRGLLRGSGMRVAWIAPQGCAYYPVYELAQTFLRSSGDTI